MSSSRTNALTKDYSGKFGDQYVLRRKNGKSLMTKLPEKFKGEPTIAQLAVKQRFLAATEYAVRILRIPEHRAAYTARICGRGTAYNMAMTDFLNPPAVIEIGITEYNGNAGDTVRVMAVDNFKVTRVTVAIIDEANTVLESGNCIQEEEGSGWIYTVTTEHKPITGQKIRAIAYDLPQNTGEAVISV